MESKAATNRRPQCLFWQHVLDGTPQHQWVLLSKGIYLSRVMCRECKSVGTIPNDQFARRP